MFIRSVDLFVELGKKNVITRELFIADHMKIVRKNIAHTNNSLLTVRIHIIQQWILVTYNMINMHMIKEIKSLSKYSG